MGRFALLLLVTPYLPVSNLSPAACCAAHGAAMAVGWAIAAACEAASKQHHAATHPHTAGPAARCVAAFGAAPRRVKGGAPAFGGDVGRARGPVWISKVLAAPALLWSALFPGSAAARAAFAAEVAATCDAHFARSFMKSSVVLDCLMLCVWVQDRAA